MYLTPKRFRNMGLGIKLAGIPDVEIREHLQTAREAVDAYCAVPTVPQPFSFLGGTITDEEHGWGASNRSGRVYPYHRPIKEVTSFRVLATESLFIEFADGDYFINKAENYIEVINLALTKIGLWGQSNIPQMGLIDPVARLSYSYGHSFPVVDDEFFPTPDTTSGDEATEWLSSNGFWTDDTETITVDGFAPGSYTVDRRTGLITFAAAIPISSEVLGSYSYRIPSAVARANALGAVSLMGESVLAGKGMVGIESIEIEEVRLRRIGSRSGAEKGIELPMAAQNLLDGYRFWTVR